VLESYSIDDLIKARPQMRDLLGLTDLPERRVMAS
jgi:hypothetical protein